MIKVEDKDGKNRDYKMTYKEAFRRVCWHYGFSKKNLQIEIMPDEEGNLRWWFLKNGKGWSVVIETRKNYKFKFRKL